MVRRYVGRHVSRYMRRYAGTWQFGAVVKRSVISAHIAWGTNRKLNAASLHPSSHMALDDLEPLIWRSSVLGTTINCVLWPNGHRQVSILYGKYIENHNYAGSSNLSSRLTFVDLELNISRSSCLDTKWRAEITAHILWGANRNPYAASYNPSSHFSLIDLEAKISIS